MMVSGGVSVSIFLLRKGYGPEDFFHEAGGMVDFDQGVAVFAALFLVGHDKAVVIGFELRAFPALAAAAGPVGAAFPLRRRVTAVRPEVEDGVQVGRQVVGEWERTIDDGGFDGILPEFLFGTLLQKREQIIFHGTHSVDLFGLENERRPRIARHLSSDIFRGQRGLRVLFSAVAG
jgi:hypothetical protein